MLITGRGHVSVLLGWEMAVALRHPAAIPAAAERDRARLRHDDAIGRAAAPALADCERACFSVSGWRSSSGMAVGIAMGMFPTLRRILDPYVNAFYAMPTVALVPLVIIWLGLGFEAKVFLTWLVAIFPSSSMLRSA